MTREDWRSLSAILAEFKRDAMTGWGEEEKLTACLAAWLRDHDMPVRELELTRVANGPVTRYGLSGINLGFRQVFEFDAETGEAVRVRLSYCIYAPSLAMQDGDAKTEVWLLTVEATRSDMSVVSTVELMAP